MKQWLSARDLCERYSVHRTTIYRWKDEGILPAPKKFGDTRQATVRWWLPDIEAWEKSRPNEGE